MTTSICVIPPQRIWFVNEPAGIGSGIVRTAGPLSIASFANGRVRGSVHVSSPGTLLVKQELVRGSGDLEWDVPFDPTQPPGTFQYPFDIFNDWPFLTLEWTQGGALTTFFRAMATVMPV